MIEKYVFKHKDNPVIAFEFDSETLRAVNIIDIADETRLPFILPPENKYNTCLLELNDWINYRGMPESRDNYINILFETGASSGKELSINSLGLNLSDHYWLHKEKLNLKWEKLNFFDNNFKEVVLKNAFNDNTSNIHPDFSVDGRLIKKWVCYNNERFLIKEGSAKDLQEPFNELIASNILDFYNIDHVKYDIKKIDKRIVSVCKCMVDKNSELIPAKYVFDKDGKIQDNPYNHFIKVCSENGIKDARKNIDEMIILDCIIGNEDRHRRNFGILRNPDTLEWLGFAPVFDNGNSLCFREGSNMENLEKRTDSYCKWFERSNMQKLEYIDISNWYNNKFDRNIIDIVAEGLKNNINDEKRNKILVIVKNRIEFAENYISERKNTVATGFTLEDLSKKTGYIQGVCESVLALGDDYIQSKKLFSKMKITKEDAKKYAHPETYKKLEEGIFSQKQEQNINKSRKR